MRNREGYVARKSNYEAYDKNIKLKSARRGVEDNESSLSRLATRAVRYYEYFNILSRCSFKRGIVNR